MFFSTNTSPYWYLLSNVEARALIYQGILITNEIETKLELIKILKNLFIKDEIGNAFKIELVKILKEIDIDKIPSNFTNFYKVYMMKVLHLFLHKTL